MNIGAIWANQADDGQLKITQNSQAEVPLNRLVHNIHDIHDLYSCVIIDRGVVSLIQKMLVSIPEVRSQQEIFLTLLGFNGDTFKIQLHIIPFYVDGVVAYHLYAADTANQDLLRQYRNFAKQANYDISQF